MKSTLENINIVFLVSRGRSGSTLVQSIFDAHPNICAPIESKFVLHLATKYQHIKNWEQQITTSFIKDIYTNRKFRLFWNVTESELQTLFNQYKVQSFQDACKIIYISHHSMFPKNNIELIIDKNPLYARFIPDLQSIFPEAKFIHLIRDPRAATYSHAHTLMQKNIPQLAYEWRLLNKKVEKCKTTAQHLFYTVKYEDLVTNPNQEFEKLFDFVGINFTSKLLEANQTIKNKYKSNKYLAQTHHKNVTQPISDLNLAKWKNKLTEKEVNIINIICEQQLTKYHYDFNKVSHSMGTYLIVFIGKLRSNLKNWLLHIMFKSPFSFRTLLYDIVSLKYDKKFK